MGIFYFLSATRLNRVSNYTLYRVPDAGLPLSKFIRSMSTTVSADQGIGNGDKDSKIVISAGQHVLRINVSQ